MCDAVAHVRDLTITEEIRLQIFGSTDTPIFPATLLSDGDSVYSRENLLDIWGTPEKNVFDMYGDSCENLLEILAVVII